MAYESEIEAVVDACHRIAASGLVRGSSGNVSLRVGEDCMLLTACGAWLGEITPDQVLPCTISTARALDERAPSTEIGFHAGILRQRHDVNVVLHCQSPAATVLACRDIADINFYVIPEIPYHIGPVSTVLYLPPGSPGLVRAVVAAFRGENLALLQNHGQVVLGRDFQQAIDRAIFFELACHIILENGKAVQALPHAEAQDLMRKAHEHQAKSI